MKYAVLVPGIMGSVLKTTGGDEAWPPRVTFSGVHADADALLRPDLQVGDIVRKVACFSFYQPLIDTLTDLGFRETGSDRLILFPYDWRKDLDVTSRQLAQELAVLAQDATSITIVAHSMGGLVARLAVERSDTGAKPWTDKITSLITLATPHRGAPLSLARILGLEGTTGLSADDCRKVSNDPDYPSAYQLLPAPGEQACWDTTEGQRLPVVDIYDPTAAEAIGLKPAMVARARWVHETLQQGQKPASIRYFYFAASGYTTATRLNLLDSQQQVMTTTPEAGDGTVPLWSALPAVGQRQVVVGSHTDLYSQEAFNAVFYRLFGATYAEPALRALPEVTATLSVRAPTLPAAEPIELLIAFSSPTDTLDTTLELVRLGGADLMGVQETAPIPVHYKGPDIPYLKLLLPPVETSGLYRIRGTAPIQGEVTFAAIEAET